VVSCFIAFAREIIITFKIFYPLKQELHTRIGSLDSQLINRTAINVPVEMAVAGACHKLPEPVVHTRPSLPGKIRIPGSRIEIAREVPVVRYIVLAFYPENPVPGMTGGDVFTFLEATRASTGISSQR
jgi:hypothetical protein